MHTLTWRVGALAARRGWGAGRLAEAAQLDEKTVRKIISGRATRVDLNTIARLSQALGVTPGALWEVRLADAWQTSAGSAGEASPGELDEVLSGGLSERTDPALERALRVP